MAEVTAMCPGATTHTLPGLSAAQTKVLGLRHMKQGSVLMRGRRDHVAVAGPGLGTPVAAPAGGARGHRGHPGTAGLETPPGRASARCAGSAAGLPPPGRAGLFIG